MISIHLKDSNAKADLMIDCQCGTIGITVVVEGKQLDFDMSFEEWELTTSFLNAQLSNQLRNANAALDRYCRSQAAGFDLRGAPIGFYDMEPETYNKETNK